MKYLVLTLTAAALVTGCIRPPDDGGGSNSERFKLEFAVVRSVTVDDWGVTPLPAVTNGGTTPSDPVPPTNRAVVRIEGKGTVEQEWQTLSARPEFVEQRGTISLSYSIGIDNGCGRTAEAARKEGRTLIVEGYGTVAQAVAAQVCYPGPIPGGTAGGSGGSEGGTIGSNTGSAQANSYYACPQPLDPARPQNSAEPSRPEYNCWCQPPLPAFYVRAEKLASCSLGGKSTEPPATEPPTGGVEPQPAPQPL